MKILLLNHNTRGRGTYVRCQQFGRCLAALGHQVTLLTAAPDFILRPQASMRDGVRVVSMPDIVPARFRNGGFGPLDTALRLAYVAGERFDVVESFDHRPTVLLPALFARYVKRMPLVSEWTDLHGSGGSMENRPRWLRAFMEPVENFVERRSKHLPRTLVVISNGLRERAIALGVPESRIHWIPGGADVERIQAVSRADARQAFAIPAQIRLLGYTGYSHYDMAMALEAVSHVQARFPDLWLATTGAGLPAEARARLHDPARVMELGHLPDGRYEQFLAAVDLFVFPFADKEMNRGRWPNKIGDYMAAGRPTVSNRTGDLIDLFERHEIGLLSPDDPVQMAACMIRILESAPLAEALGHNARRTAETHYDWRKLTRTLETCLLDAARSHP